MHPLMRRRWRNHVAYCSASVRVQSTTGRSAATPGQRRQAYLSERRVEPDDDQLEEDELETNSAATAGRSDRAQLVRLLGRLRLGEMQGVLPQGIVRKSQVAHLILLEVKPEEEDEDDDQMHEAPPPQPALRLEELHAGQLVVAKMTSLALEQRLPFQLCLAVLGRAGVGKSAVLHYLHSRYGPDSIIALCQTNTLALKLSGYTLDSFAVPRRQRNKVNRDLERWCQLSALGLRVMRNARVSGAKRCTRGRRRWWAGCTLPLRAVAATAWRRLCCLTWTWCL